MFSALQPVRSLSNVFSEIQVGAASAERVFGILDTKPAIIDNDSAIKDIAFNKNLEFNHVFFQYNDDEEYVLEDISFSLTKGSVVALVGVSGAGKSTIADLIPRFYDVQEGAISIDGQDIRDIKIKSLRDLLGIVGQEVILFNDSIKNNIQYGLKNVNRDQIAAAAKMANAIEFIEDMPLGFETVIGEKGVKLSGGQKQRIAIARAILKNPPILILDEATSSLDTESEQLVQQAIEQLMKDRTVLVIAHRLSTVRNADKIIVMEKGRIIEKGKHSELYQKDGTYRRLYELQFIESEKE